MGLQLGSPRWRTVVDEHVRDELAQLDESNIRAASAKCRTREGAPMQKPPPLFHGMHERWMEEWIKIVRKHNEACVSCGDHG